MLTRKDRVYWRLPESEWKVGGEAQPALTRLSPCAYRPLPQTGEVSSSTTFPASGRGRTLRQQHPGEGSLPLDRARRLVLR
jgi:hypothetical protein